MKELKRKENKEVKPQELVFLFFFFVFLLSRAREVEWKEIRMEKILTIGVAVDWGRKWGNLYYFRLFFFFEWWFSAFLLPFRQKHERKIWVATLNLEQHLFCNYLSFPPFSFSIFEEDDEEDKLRKRSTATISLSKPWATSLLWPYLSTTFSPFHQNPSPKLPKQMTDIYFRFWYLFLHNANKCHSLQSDHALVSSFFLINTNTPCPSSYL